MIYIGFAGSLSGEGHEVGTAAKNGFQMAVNEINESGGINGKEVVAVIKDDQSNPEIAMTIVKEFKDEDINYVIGFLTSNMTPAVLEGIKSEILFLSPSMSTTLLSGKDDLFIRNIDPLNYISRELGRAISNQGIENLAIVYDLNNSSYTVPFMENVEEIYTSLDGKIVYKKGLDDEDLLVISDEIISSDSDGLCLILPAYKVAELVQYLRQSSYEGSIALPQWAMVNELIMKGGKAVEGAFGITNYNKELVTESLSNFKTSYIEQFDEEPSFIAINAYEATLVLLEGLEHESSPIDVKNYLVDKTYEGLQSHYTIDKNGDGLREFYIIKIKDGHIVPVN